MVSTFNVIDTAVKFSLLGPEGAAKGLKYLVTSYIGELDSLIDQVEELEKLVKAYEEKVIDMTALGLTTKFIAVLTETPYIRRVLGEKYFWDLYEMSKILEGSLLGDLVGNSIDSLKGYAKDGILYLLDFLNADSLTTVLEPLARINQTLYTKILDIPVLPHMYPQVTTQSSWLTPGDVVGGVSVQVDRHFDTYKDIPLPVFEKPSDVLIFNPKNPDYTLLRNAGEYKVAWEYWTSNFRTSNNWFVNGIFTAPIDTSLDGKSPSGPSFSDQLAHRKTYVSTWPVFDLYGDLVTMSTWNQATTPLGQPEETSYDLSDPFSGATFTRYPIQKSEPRPDKWSLMDAIYEMYEILVSTDGLCESYPSMLAKFQKTLDTLGLTKYSASDFSERQADHRSAPIQFSANILGPMMSEIKSTIKELEERVAKVRAIVQRW